MEMSENDKKRESLVYKLSYIGVFFFFLWGAVWVYCIVNSPNSPDEGSGKVYAIYYKAGKNIYVTQIQSILLIALPIAGFLSFPALKIITSPRLDLFKNEENK